MKKIPENISELLQKPIGTHNVNYFGEKISIRKLIQRTKSELKHGIMSPVMYEKLKKKGIELEIPIPKTRGAKEVHSEHLDNSKRFDDVDGEIKKNGLKIILLDPRGGPTLIHSKTGNLTSGHILHKIRIQPRFIRAVILPKVGFLNKKRYVWGLKKFGKPIYDHRGVLVWKPEIKKKK
mgnify:FL=1